MVMPKPDSINQEVRVPDEIKQEFNNPEVI